MCVFRSGLAFGGVRVRCLCVRCVLCLVCLPLRVRPRVCPVPVLRFWEEGTDRTRETMYTTHDIGNESARTFAKCVIR